MCHELDTADCVRPARQFASYSKTAAAAKANAAAVAPGVYTAHEAMQLDLEEALTRDVVCKQLKFLVQLLLIVRVATLRRHC